MKVLSLKLKDEIFKEAEQMVKEARVSRNAYINKAVELYNKINRRQKLRTAFRRASKLVRAESIKVLREMEGLDPHLIE